MNAWKVIPAVALIFSAGVVTGGLLVHRTTRQDVTAEASAPAIRLSSPQTPGVMRLELLRRLQRQLNLAPEQEQQINSILSQSQERHRKIVEPLAPQLQEELHRATAEFRAVLTSEQRELFDNLASQTRGRGKPARSRLPAP